MNRSLARAFLAATFIVGLLVISAGPAAPAVLRAPKLLPDLMTYTPSGFIVQMDGPDRILRFNNEVDNANPGVLELFPVADDCDGDGDPDNDRTAYQQIYRDNNENGRFDRGFDKKVKPIEVGCFLFHVEHNHWHFENFAKYQLQRVSDGKIMKQADKISFCIIDTTRRFPNVPGSPGQAFYRGCGADDTTGLSAGWGDVYANYLDGQELDITSLPDGRYCFISTADPSDLLRESNNSNNKATALVEIAGTEVEDLQTPC